MKECDNSTRKIHINSNFILSISLLIMFDTLLPRPSLLCNSVQLYAKLHSDRTTNADSTVKVKVQVTLEQATKSQRGSRGVALLFP